MRKGKKELIAAVCAFALMTGSISAGAAGTYTPSSWAQPIIAIANTYHIIPQDTQDKSYTQDITRLEFSHYAVTLYTAMMTVQGPDTAQARFSDTNDKYVLYAADLGLISGRGDGTFAPNDAVTRQEMAVIITRLLAACGVDTSVSGQDAVKALSGYTDTNAVKSWSINPVVFCLKNEILKGMSETELWPEAHTTREQAIVIIYRCFDTFATEQQKQNCLGPLGNTDDSVYSNLSAVVKGDGKLIAYQDRKLSVEFPMIASASEYKIDIYLDSSNFWYSDEDVYVKTLYSHTNSFAFDNIRIGKQYKIIVSAADSVSTKKLTLSAYVEPVYTLEEKELLVFGGKAIDSKEAADSVMQEIEVNVWRVDQNGQKYASKAWLTVHKKIADITKAAFEEIFNGKERFPMKDVGAYAWRDTMSSGRYSHHNYGTAIDINYNENYCLYKDGSTIGGFWLPKENIYSIAPDSEVVSIFSKYGFVWGGDEWSNPKDYMHFSYLEL